MLIVGIFLGRAIAALEDCARLQRKYRLTKEQKERLGRIAARSLRDCRK